LLATPSTGDVAVAPELWLEVEDPPELELEPELPHAARATTAGRRARAARVRLMGGLQVGWLPVLLIGDDAPGEPVLPLTRRAMLSLR